MYKVILLPNCVKSVFVSSSVHLLFSYNVTRTLPNMKKYCVSDQTPIQGIFAGFFAMKMVIEIPETG